MLLQSRAALVAASKRTLSLPGSWQGGKVKQADNLDTRHAVIDQVAQGASELWSEENLFPARES